MKETKQNLFKGVCTALITPFTKDGKKIDFNNFEKQIDFQIDKGITNLVFLGTTGESPTVTESERVEIIKFAKKYVKNRANIIVGTGSNSTSHSVNLSVQAEKFGADALLVVTPYYNKATQEGLFEHYKTIAENVHIPVLIYNVPSRTGVNVQPETLNKLSQIPNICGVKEASGNIDQICEMAKFASKDFLLLSGDDALFVPILSLGGSGVISVASNIIPDKMLEIYNCWQEQNWQKSLKKQSNMREFIKLLFCEVNPIPIKSIMKYAKMDNGTLRLPLTQIQQNDEKKIMECYERLIQTLD